MERVKQMLFRPFDLGKWFVIGFCAWLAYLGEGGGTYNFNPANRHHRGGNPGEQLEQAKEYVMNNLSWLIPVVIVCVLVLPQIARMSTSDR